MGERLSKSPNARDDMRAMEGRGAKKNSKEFQAGEQREIRSAFESKDEKGRVKKEVKGEIVKKDGGERSDHSEKKGQRMKRRRGTRSPAYSKGRRVFIVRRL